MSFTRFHSPHVTALPVELAVLLVGVASRQAASPTARAQASLSAPAPAAWLLAPETGCFSAATAAALTAWQDE